MPIYVDGDACPVKEEVYRVARRYAMKVYVVANTSIRVPEEELIEAVLVRGGFDVADDWIVERIGPDDIVITTDIPLADRCLQKGARAIGPKGHAFSEDSMGEALATRALHGHAPSVGHDRRRPGPLRQAGSVPLPREARRDHPGDPTRPAEASLAVTDDPRCPQGHGACRGASPTQRPFSMTWRTDRMARMSASGSPSTRTRSASLPGSTLPRRSAQPRKRAPRDVAATIASPGLSPHSTSSSSSR